MTYHIYMIHNDLNQKVYIGQTVTPKERWSAHRRGATATRQKQIVHKAMKSHGVHNFSFKIIESVETRQEASEAERFWIGFYESSARAFGYNQDLGGYYRCHTEETRRKCSVSKLGELNPNFRKFGSNHHNFGRKKLSKTNLMEIQRLRSLGATFQDLANKFCVSRQTLRTSYNNFIKGK